MKLYRGVREDTCKVSVTDGEGKTYALPPRLDLRQHTVDGTFEWGYRGSGPSQLALAITADVTGNDIYTMTIYTQVRDLLISRLPLNEWTISSPELREFC